MARQDELVFVALGGLGEIGMNLGLYGYGPPEDRQWLMVDCGVTFAAEEHLPGIDLILPDVSFVEGERGSLCGIVLTHAHEDHFGALPDLWERLGSPPVYATAFTAGLLAAKLDEERGAPSIAVDEVPLGGRFKVGPFDLELVSTTHSIPEPNAIILRTPVGTVLHTGDWKVDYDPLIGEPFDAAPFEALGEEGCLALVGDSTNAVREGRSPGEGDVAKVLAELIAQAPARVAVTCFASNLARMRAVAKAAAEAGRKVILVGRAMRRTVMVARELGYLDGIAAFLGEEEFAALPRDKAVLLCTGSQGEPRAALTRIAAGNHPTVSLGAGDRVIYSARTIPGNEREVGSVVNALIRGGVDVITDRTHLVHVSGHPRRDELRDMFGWVRPRIAIPVHGEALHLDEHARLAREAGVPEVVTAYNGDVVLIGPGAARIIDEAPSGRVYKDGRLLVDSDSEGVRQRRRLASAGAVTISLAVDGRGDAVGEPAISVFGLPEFDDEGASFAEIAADAVDEVLDSLPRGRRRNPEVLGEAVRRAVRGAIAASWGKKPLCQVHILPV